MSDQQQPQGFSAAGQVMSAADLERRIREHEQAAEQLTSKLEEFSNYELDGGNFDSRAYKRDELRLGTINRELTKMYADRNTVEKRSDQWVDFAKRKAADFLRGRINHFPEDIREDIQKEFTQNFRETVQGGIFENPQAQSEDQITAIVRDRFDHAVGRAYSARAQRREDGSRENPPGEKGLDRDDEAPPAPDEDDWAEGDEFAKQLFSQYESDRNRKHMTLADQQRARFAERNKQKEGEE